MSWGAIVVGVGTAVYSGIRAAKQKKEAKKLIKKAGEEKIASEIQANQTEAQKLANEGLPAQQYDNAMKNIQRQQLMVLRGAQDRRGGLATITATQQAADDALGKLDAEDANQRRVNQQLLMGVNNQVGGLKHNIWERQYDYGMQMLGFGNANQNKAADSLIAAGGKGLEAYLKSRKGGGMTTTASPSGGGYGGGANSPTIDEYGLYGNG